MKFSMPMSEVSVGGFSGSKKPEPNTAYIMHVVKAWEGETSGSVPKWVVELDVSVGECAGFFSKRPIWYNREVGSKAGLEYTKRALRDFVKSNKGMITDDDVAGSEFDFSKLQGMLIGAKLVNDDKGFLKVDKLFDTEYVAKYNSENKKEESEKIVDTSTNNETKLDSTPVAVGVVDGYDDLPF